MENKDKVKFNVGDVVRMKKPHPCGSHEWKITRTGMDFGLTCEGCGHHVMLPRPKFIRLVKDFVRRAEEN